MLHINIYHQGKINLARKGRVKEKPAKETLTDPRSQLEDLMKDKGVSFDVLKERLTKEEFKNAENLNSLDDIPKLKIFELIARLKKAKANTVTK